MTNPPDFASFPGLAQMPVDAGIPLPPRVLDLAKTFPLLFFMLATDSGSFARRLEVIRLVEQGAQLADVAAIYRLPLCLRRVTPASCLAPLPWVDWSAEATSRLGNHIPSSTIEAGNWLGAVFLSAHAANESFALWVARHRALFTGPVLDCQLVMPLALYAWHSVQVDGPLAAITTMPWSPQFGLPRAIAEAEAWLIRLHLLTFCGTYPIADTWLDPGDEGRYQFVPITTYEQLLSERAALQNCLHTYVDRLATGACRIFVIKQAGHSVAALELVADHGGRPRIAQLKGPGNIKAPPDVHAAAHAWADRQRSPRIPRRTVSSLAHARLVDLLRPYHQAIGLPDGKPRLSATAMREQLANLSRHFALAQRRAQMSANATIPAVEPPRRPGGLPVSPTSEARVRLLLQRRVGEEVFNAWFRHLVIDTVDAGTLRASVPVRFLQRWLTAHYLDDIRTCCSAVWPGIHNVEISHRPPASVAAPQPPPAQFDRLHGGAPPLRRTRVDDVLAVVERRYLVTRADILSARRHRAVALPRQIGIYIAHRLTLYSLPEIGRRFGNRDHTTILYAIRKVERMMEEDTRFRAEVEALQRAAAEVRE